MALTDQPYLPWYVDDWMNNIKLRQCSPSAHGIMAAIMCLMHKSNDGYGKILLKQKYNVCLTKIESFASQLTRHFAWSPGEIRLGLEELIIEKVLLLDGDYLICDRMVRDAQISEIRKVIGRKGGKNNKKKNGFASDFAQAKIEANTGNENGIENETENGIEMYLGGVGEKEKKTKGKRNAFPFPPDFQVTDEMKDWAINIGVTSEKIKSETDHWEDHHKARGNKFKDWGAAWRTWMRNHVKFQGNGGPHGKPRGGNGINEDFSTKDYQKGAW